MMYQPLWGRLRVGDVAISFADDRTRFCVYEVTNVIPGGAIWQYAAKPYGDRSSHPLITLFHISEFGTLATKEAKR